MQLQYTNGEGETFSLDEVSQKYGIDPHLVGALFRYLNDRIAPGGFLQAVLTNDLYSAIARGDSQSIASLPGLVKFLYNRVEAWAYGTPEKYRNWLSDRSGMPLRVVR